MMMKIPAQLTVTALLRTTGVRDGRIAMEPKETDCCWNCKYFKGTHDDGKTKCGNPDQWNTWIKPQEGCEWWKEAHNDNH